MPLIVPGAVFVLSFLWSSTFILGLASVSGKFWVLHSMAQLLGSPRSLTLGLVLGHFVFVFSAFFSFLFPPVPSRYSQGLVQANHTPEHCDMFCPTLSVILDSCAQSLEGKDSGETSLTQQVFFIGKHIVNKDSGANGGKSGSVEVERRMWIQTFALLQQLRASVYFGLAQQCIAVEPMIQKWLS